ncbi:MAG: toll/interleukin-1 receptor domain-containing protein [Desulfobacterales bacterium]|nr:toll/interleukin-1 receptor domain-containing protein [Desulfobacterales bacterium]
MQNLETVKHIGPSHISISTIYNSGAGIPRLFLRGCGIPENFIQHLPSLVGRPLPFASCFISFSHVDRPFAEKLHDHLQDRGIRCWLDEHQARQKDDGIQRVERGISRRDRAVALLFGGVSYQLVGRERDHQSLCKRTAAGERQRPEILSPHPPEPRRVHVQGGMAVREKRRDHLPADGRLHRLENRRCRGMKGSLNVWSTP